MISVRDLRMHYRVHAREPGLGAALRSLFRRRYETVRAVDGVSFEVARGERIAILGPNGAGKTTVLKVLAGLLHPTSGRVEVAAHDPKQRSRAFLGRVSLLLGQRSQLLWDLPASETFELNRVLYDVSRPAFDATMREVVELLGIGEVVRRPVRQLSLGERTKCEIAAALVHRPEVLFWDEPTIGLDVGMQLALRDFVRRYSDQTGATLVLTSHDMDDVTALCPRVLLMGAGKLMYDGLLDELARRVRPDKRVVLRFMRPVDAESLRAVGEVLRQDDQGAIVRVARSSVNTALAVALAELPLRDLTLEDAPIEEIMAELMADGALASGAPGVGAPR